MRRRSDISALSLDSKGFTLLEVMIAIFLTALVVLSVFAVALSTKRQTSKSTAKLEADYAAKNLMNQLNNYITASVGSSTDISDLEAGPDGPGTTASWVYPTDTCGPPSTCPDGSAASTANRFCGCLPAGYSGCVSPTCVCGPLSGAGSNSYGGNCYALQVGCVHNVTASLPQVLRTNYNMELCYAVTDASGNGGSNQANFQPMIQVDVPWKGQ